LAGLLGRSRVKESPTTQPFNNTSVILGGLAWGNRILFTADAGAEALGRINPEWKQLTWLQIPHHGSDGNLSQELIERFCPRFAYISARGDESHPSRAIVSGLVKAGAQVFSTHLSGNLCHYLGNVPFRPDYSPAVPMKGTGAPKPIIDWTSLVPGSLG
jgi:beta-lactamase superfamily II metal-dependent hydrolase